MTAVRGARRSADRWDGACNLLTPVESRLSRGFVVPHPGHRLGDLLALAWGAIDLRVGRLHVREAVAGASWTASRSCAFFTRRGTSRRCCRRTLGRTGSNRHSFSPITRERALSPTGPA